MPAKEFPEKNIFEVIMYVPNLKTVQGLHLNSDIQIKVRYVPFMIIKLTKIKHVH